MSKPLCFMFSPLSMLAGCISCASRMLPLRWDLEEAR